MSLQNQPGMFQGSAPLNPLPYVNIVMQARNKKAAREEALDRYYQKLPDTINDKGVRDEEIEIINHGKNQLFEFGVKNREALRNPKIDNGAAQLAMDKMIRKLSGVARNSQDLAKRGLQRGKMYLSKDGRWAVDDEEFMNAEEAESQPAYILDKNGEIVENPNHVKMDEVKMLSNRPYDEAEYAKEIKSKVQYGTKPIRTADPTDPNYEIVSNVPDLDQTAKDKIYALATDKYHGNKRFKKMIDSKTPEQLAELNDISKEVFGHYIREDFAPEDISAAYSVLQLPVTSTKSKVQASIAGKQKFSKEMQEERQRFAEAQQLRGYQFAIKRQENAAKLGLTGQPTPPNILDEFTVEFGEAYKDPLSGQTLTIVDTKNIPAKYRPLLTTPGITVGDKTFYVVDETGSFIGNDKQVITPVSATDNFVKTYGNTKFKLEGRKKFLEENKDKKIETKKADTPKEELDPKGFKKEGKYWKYKDGRLFDDNGNVIKQK